MEALFDIQPEPLAERIVVWVHRAKGVLIFDPKQTCLLLKPGSEAGNVLSAVLNARARFF
jgi:hypothetical protein